MNKKIRVFSIEEFSVYDGPGKGFDKETKVFNNKISMTFEELDDISKLLNHSDAIASKHQTKWTFYSSWWLCKIAL